MVTDVGFIGVGRMGSAMASRLIEAGESVTVYDIDEQQVEAMRAVGAHTADSIRSLVSRSDVIFTSLPRGRHVEDVYLGSDGIIESIPNGKTLVETSTVKPKTMRLIERAIEERKLDVTLIDSPVIGVPTTARRGELTILVGGSEDAIAGIEPYLKLIGESFEHVGPIGRAKAIKLVNNIVTYGNFAVAAEAFALGDWLGIEREALFDIIDSGAAHSSIVRSKIPNMLEENFAPGFPVNGACKDLEYALDVSRVASQSLPITEMVADRYEYAAAQGAGDVDYSALVPIFSSNAWNEADQSE